MTFNEILSCLPVSLQKNINDMLALFEGVDQQTKEFAGATGLKCKNGCGACCENPEIETTAAEVMPLAVHLWSQGLAENKMEAIRSKSNKGICVFYESDPANSKQGRCGIYAYRPGICRLFGFAARQDKHGKPVLMTCRIIKDSQPQVCERTQEQLNKGLSAPLLTKHALGVSNIDPVHGQKFLPINQAISMAVEKIGFSAQVKNKNWQNT